MSISYAIFSRPARSFASSIGLIRARNGSNVRPSDSWCESRAHTRSCLTARMSAGHETGDSASDRPIFTLLHAGVGGCIEKPFGRYHWQYKDWCSPDDALRADDTETTQVEAAQATREAASSRKASPHTGHPVQ